MHDLDTEVLRGIIKLFQEHEHCHLKMRLSKDDQNIHGIHEAEFPKDGKVEVSDWLDQQGDLGNHQLQCSHHSHSPAGVGV
jgi:hypothetical protein